MKLLILTICFSVSSYSCFAAPSPTILLEKSRAHYRQSEWDRLFAIATYSRILYPKTKETDSIRILEILALLRHCQLEKAKLALSEALIVSHSHIDDLQTLQLLLNADDHTIQKEISQLPTEQSSSAYAGRNLWKLSDKSHLSEIDPFSLRKHVTPLCEGDK